tara:strand:+ start:1673 stop:1963 length:291 start_codon:yes stop_codon:yes gene_type:complete
VRDLAIRNTYPTVVTIRGETDAWDSDGNVVELDESKIGTEITRLQAEYDALEYSRNRAKAYDSVGNQLDMLMKDMKNGTTTHQEACEAVKAKYPKP